MMMKKKVIFLSPHLYALLLTTAPRSWFSLMSVQGKFELYMRKMDLSFSWHYEEYGLIGSSEKVNFEGTCCLHL